MRAPVKLAAHEENQHRTTDRRDEQDALTLIPPCGGMFEGYPGYEIAQGGD
jgi:hypothetical protein